jgi:nitrite reductase (NADH) small subunit
MNDAKWIRVTRCENVPPREGRAVLVGDRELALFNLGDRFLATDAQCPHQGGPLCDGIVTGTSVVCPLHAWKIDLETGGVVRPTHGLDHCVGTYQTRVEDGVVSVLMPGMRARVEAA